MKLIKYYYSFGRWLDDIYWITRNYLTGKRYNIVKLGGKNLWRDTDFRLEQALEVLFLDFIHNEKPFERINYERNDETKALKKDLNEIYNFFIVERAEWLFKINKLRNLTFTQMDNPTLEHTKLVKESIELKDAYKKRETEIFVKLINRRGSLWT